MAYIPTVEEFNEDYPVARWDRNTVADGKWLQENTIGPLSARDDFLLSLFEDLEGGDSWKKWSENHNSTSEYPDIASAIYLGPNNEILGSGHAYVVGENNNVSATTNVSVDIHGNITSRGGSYVFGMDNYVNDGFVIGNQITALQGSKVFGRDSTAIGCSTIIGYNASAKEGSLILNTPRDNSHKTYAEAGSIILGTDASAVGGSLIISTPGGTSKNSMNIAAGGSLILGAETGDNYAYAGSIAIGKNLTANSNGLALGTNAKAEYGAVSIGFDRERSNAYAKDGSIAIGNASAMGGSFGLGLKNGENVKANNNGFVIGNKNIFADYLSFVFGYENVSARSCAFSFGNKNIYSYGNAIAMGGDNLYASQCAVVFGTDNSATNGSFAFGKENSANYGSYSFGFRNIIDHSATNFGEDNIASNMATVFGNSNEVNNNSFNFGNYNTVTNYSINLGNNNSATEESVTFGNNNSANNNSFNFGNTNIVDNHSINFGSENVSEKHSVTFGEYNSAYNSIILGDSNKSHCEPYLIKKNTIEYARYGWNMFAQHPISASGTYSINSILPTKNIIIGYNNSAINTRNVYLIGNNNYSETTIDDLELDCDIYSTTSKGQDNDGFALAFGLGNSAIRNYDIAIGKNVLASGGENIVIGAPNIGADTENYSVEIEGAEHNITGTKYYPKIVYNTKSIGYKNLNIRSNIDGVSNIAFESILSGFELSSYYNSNNINAGAIYNTLIQSYVNVKNVEAYTGNAFVRNKFYNCGYNNILDSITIDANNKLIHITDNVFDKCREFTISPYNKNDNIDFGYNNFNNCLNLNISANYFHNNNIIKGSYANAYLSGYKFSDNTIFNLGPHNVSIIGYEVTNNTFKNLNTPTKFNSYHSHFNYVDNLWSSKDINAYYFLNNVIKNVITNGNDITTHWFENNLLYNLEITGDVTLPGEYSLLSNNIISDCGKIKRFSNYNYITHNVINNNMLFLLGPATEENEITDATFTNNILLNNNYSATDITGFDGKFVKLSGITHASFNVITNSRVSAYLNEENEPEETVFNDNLILNSIVNCELFDTEDANVANFTNNYLFNSYVESKYENKNTTDAFKNNPVQNNVIFNYSALNTNGSLAFCDGFGGGTNNVSPILSNCNAVISLGQNQIEDSVETSVYGYDNKVVSAERLYILGQHNNISADVNRDNLIAGNNNNISGSIDNTIDRNTILGNGNTLSGQFVDCNILGDCNELNNETETVFENDTLIGLHNKVEFGSNSTLIGQHNIANGYNGIAIGEGLSATNSQVVVGRFNALCEGTDDREDHSPNSGVLFIVGNGTHTEPSNYTEADVLASYEEANIQRSNAMVVSADGTVSARTYKADPTSPLGKLFDFLTTATLGTGNLHWNASTSAWSIQQQ